MAEQVQSQLPGEQSMTLSDFLLGQRRTMDQVVANYENNLSQMAQAIEQLSKENRELKTKNETLKPKQIGPEA